MASSGVLLMLSADYSGAIYAIRSRFQQCLPGVASKTSQSIVMLQQTTGVWHEQRVLAS